jgi:hypothetical protein
MRTLRRWGDAKCGVYQPSLPPLKNPVLGAASGMKPPVRNISKKLSKARFKNFAGMGSVYE